MTLMLFSFALSVAATLLVIRSARAHSHYSGDTDLDGPQKFHSHPVPRIGGVGIVAGLLVVLAYQWWADSEQGKLGVALIACALPVFLSGLAEDVTKRVSPRRRLFFAAVSAALAVWFLGAVIRHTDIYGLDWVVSFPIPAALVTIFVVVGVANSVNIIDGFNGLASMCVVMMLAAIAYVAFQAQDPLIALCALAGLGAVLGFFVWNFPAGLIFLGDGGAYFLGFYVAELSILLLQRNPQVSPLFPLLMCIYPVFETVFSIYRRKFVRGRAVGMPDGVHLHSLIYRRVMRWAVGSRTAKHLTRRNSMTSPYLWFLCMLAVVPSVLFWNNSAVLGIFIIAFGGTYVYFYVSIVRFRTPDWMIVRR
jgi:UDP-N-acetylmuramyl pentapeptide phosphotransferase/UDP-N-acetylglucosamine-1-phosphate transferase